MGQTGCLDNGGSTSPGDGTPASWGGYLGYEEFSGIIRGIQIYNVALTDAQVEAEVSNPGSTVTPWYLNLNPRPTDVADDSGSGHTPVWEGQTALEWTDGSNPTPGSISTGTTRTGIKRD